MEHILIQNGTLYTMEEGTEPFQGDLLVAEGKIKSIAKRFVRQHCRLIRKWWMRPE